MGTETMAARGVMALDGGLAFSSSRDLHFGFSSRGRFGERACAPSPLFCKKHPNVKDSTRTLRAQVGIIDTGHLRGAFLANSVGSPTILLTEWLVSQP